MPLNFDSFKLRCHSLSALAVKQSGVKDQLSVFSDFEISCHWRDCKKWRFGGPKIQLTT